MPRDIPGALATHMALEVTTLAWLVKVARDDGLTLGFTTFDRQLDYDDGGGEVEYQPSDGISVTAVDSEVGTGVDNMDVIGVLSDDRITEADLDAGLWDGASVTVYCVNWANLANGALTEFKGFIGEIEQGTVSFKCEVRGLSHMLRQVTGWETSKNCIVRRLGNAQCKVNLGGTTVGGVLIRANVDAAGDFAAGSTELTLGPHSAPTGHYSHGIIKMIDGPNAGLEREIKAHTLTGGNVCELTLRTPFPFAVSVGETALLEAGCDRTWATCGAKFANKNNFHGQAQLLGNDKLLKIGRPPG